MQQINNQQVLDACCGGRMFWFDKSDDRVLFIDNRVHAPELLSKVLELTPYKPLFGHRSGKQQKTHWVAFYKELEK